MRLSTVVVALLVMVGLVGGCATGEQPPLRQRLDETKRMELGWRRDNRLRDLGNEAVRVNAIALATDAISAIGNPHLRDRSARAAAEELEKRGERESAIIMAELILSDYVRNDTLKAMQRRSQEQIDATRAKINQST